MCRYLKWKVKLRIKLLLRILLNVIDYSLSIAVGALYVRKYFRQDSKAAALEMVNGIRKEFELLLNEVDWMDEETRQSALNKLHGMSTHIGYPDEIMNDTKIEEYYSNLEIDENNYLSSVLNMNVFGTDYAFNKLRKPVNKTDWVTDSIFFIRKKAMRIFINKYKTIT